MDDDDQFLSQVISGIAAAEIITIFFPLLRRALIVDTRHDDNNLHMVSVMPQVRSMEERISTIERLRPQLGKVQNIMGIPWIKSVNSLRENGITDQIVKRLIDADMPAFQASEAMQKAMQDLWWVEHRAFVSMIRGEGYQTIWSSTS
jgi:hypothetical protein